MFAWIGQVLGAFLGKLWEPLIQWWSAYQQGKLTELAREAQTRADESSKLADAHTRVRDVVVDDEWLHRPSPPREAPSEHGSGETRPGG